MKNFKSFLTLTFCSLFFHSLISDKAAKAQVAADGSLPTNVNQSGQTIEITGGAQAGSNLFHSFEQFSVLTGQTAFFNNASNITNILSRVTGNSISQIDGLIRANGGANLFLLNPNGIIFGQDAALDIGGSFMATTAESIVFEDGTVFDTQELQNPLLTVSMPIGLQIGSEPGSIINQSGVTNNLGEVVGGLEVNPGQNFTLVGGDINLNGGNIAAPGGQVNLGGLAAPGTVIFSDNKLSFGNQESLANVSLENEAEVNVRSSDNGGIAVNAKNLSLTGGSKLLAGIAEGLGSSESRGGDINLYILEAVTLADYSSISNTLRELSVGTGGNVNIDTSSLFLASSSKIASSNAEGTGDAGNINIRASDLISVTNSVIQSDTYGLGDAGDINLESKNGSISIEGVETGVSTAVQAGATNQEKAAIGQGGDINITARNLTLTTKGEPSEVGALLQSDTFSKGNAGDITIRVDDTINFDGALSGVSSEVGESDTGEKGIGQGGNIYIQARSLLITNGASVLSSTSGKGNAGNININASDSLVISGTAPFPTLADGEPGGLPSGLYSATEEDARGQGGDIRIDTNNLQLTDGAVLSGRSRSNFPGGNITVNARNLDIIGGGQILTTALQQGTAGDITLNVSDNIDISGGDPNFYNRLASVLGQEAAEFIINSSPASGIYANTVADSTGDSGNISINSGQLNVTDSAEISVASDGSGNGGNIDLQIENSLFLKGNSQISTTALADGDGGNITINSPFVVTSPSENSDITANANEGRGGFIQIFSEAILGLESRTRLTPFSDITAFSEQDPNLNGTVELEISEDQVLQELTELPTDIVDRSQLITKGCSVDNDSSQFLVTGTGGLPPSPTESLRSTAIDTDTVNSATTGQNPNTAQSQPIVEAQGWIVNERGNVVLTANSNNANPAANVLPTNSSCSQP
jgi:filamentous hemagglutinin family protein